MSLKRQITLYLIRLLLDSFGKEVGNSLRGGRLTHAMLSGERLSDLIRQSEHYKAWLPTLRGVAQNLDWDLIDALLRAFRERRLTAELHSLGFSVQPMADLTDQEREWIIEGIEDILREIRG